MFNYKNEDALVLFSGGQDSTTCLYWAKKVFRSVHALCFSYGQRHSLEVDIARAIAEEADVSFQLMDASIISQLAPSSLTDSSIVMDEEQPDGSFPNTFVPGRNLIFLTFAATVAYAKGINHIVIGVSEADYSGYPDCRDSFIHSANATINLAMDSKFRIHTPLMSLDKAGVWRVADEMGVFDIIKNQTLTCYNGIRGNGCGKCPACKLRNSGLSKHLSTK